MFHLRPINNLTDGAFERPSIAWHLVGGTYGFRVALTPVNGRRIVDVLGERWIWIEGARENYLDDPLDLEAGGWDNPTTSGTQSAVLPDETTGNASVLDTFDIVNQEFRTSASNNIVVASVFAVDSGVEYASIDLNIVNGISPLPVTAPAPEQPPSNWWARTALDPVSLANVGGKSYQLADATHAVLAWGACVESGPGFTTDALFMSQPILVRGVREAEKFVGGIITAAQVARAPRAVRVMFRPEFDSTDVATGDKFIVAYFDTGTPTTSLRVWLEATSAGVIRARAGYSVTFASSNPITFTQGANLVIELMLATGAATISGADTGNSTFTNGAYDLVAGSGIYIGSDPTPANHAFSLIAPLEIGFDDVLVTGIEQLTRSSVRVTFSEAVLQFDKRGLVDALNPAHYDVSGSPGLPSILGVDPGTVGTEVVVFFDRELADGSLVRLLVHDIVSAGVPVGVLATTVSFLAFGDEVNAALVREQTFARVDLANPQTEADAASDATLGTLGVTETGDLANDRDRGYLRKRILRRLTTVKDAFFHLVGYGLRPPTKALLTPTTLRALQVDVERQVREEPGVVTARARVTEIQPGLVAVRLDVTDDSGSFEVAGQIDFTAE